MNVTGLWEVVSANTLDMKAMEMVWKTKEEALASDMDEDFKRLYSSLFDFKEDGTLAMLMKGPAADAVPKAELDEAVAAGQAFVEDGIVFVPRTLNGKWREKIS